MELLPPPSAYSRPNGAQRRGVGNGTLPAGRSSWTPPEGRQDARVFIAVKPPSTPGCSPAKSPRIFEGENVRLFLSR